MRVFLSTLHIFKFKVFLLDDLLKRVADIKQWILIASYKLFSIESDALIALVVDLLNRKCSILDVSDILTIASEDAELLVQVCVY